MSKVSLNGFVPQGASSLKSKMFSSDTIWAASFLSQQVNPYCVTDEGERPGKEKLSKGPLKKSSAELRLNYFSAPPPVFWMIPNSGVQKVIVFETRTQTEMLSRMRARAETDAVRNTSQ